MTIRQVYTHGKEVFTITITGKKVYYKDRKLTIPVQIIPMDIRIKRSILTSRNRIDKKLIDQFKLTEEEQGEYNEALKSGKDIEEELGKICIKDSLSQGAILQMEERSW